MEVNTKFGIIDEQYYALKDKFDKPRELNCFIINTTPIDENKEYFDLVYKDILSREIFITGIDGVSKYTGKYQDGDLKYTIQEKLKSNDVIVIVTNTVKKLIINPKYKNISGSYEYFAIRTGIPNLYDLDITSNYLGGL